MGLDITEYRKLVKIVNPKLDENGYLEDWQTQFQPWVNPDFAERAKDIEHRAVYTYTDSFAFRAGSYGGYNDWRRKLAVLAEYASVEAAWAATSGPFWELIYFADNEGVIGSEVSAKLAKDFADHADKLAEFTARFSAPDAAWFSTKYQEWKTAFEMAADGGAVSFH